MAEERDDEQFGETEGKIGQQTTGQQGQQSEFGKQQGTEPIASGQGSTGNEFGQSKGESAFGETATSGGGQSDLGSQSGTTLAGRADQQDQGQDQPRTTGSATGQSGPQGEGFIGSQGTGSEEYLQSTPGATTDASATGATGGSDFAEKGQGATEDKEEETGAGSTGGGFSGGGSGGSGGGGGGGSF